MIVKSYEESTNGILHVLICAFIYYFDYIFSTYDFPQRESHS